MASAPPTYVPKNHMPHARSTAPLSPRLFDSLSTSESGTDSGADQPTGLLLSEEFCESVEQHPTKIPMPTLCVATAAIRKAQIADRIVIAAAVVFGRVSAKAAPHSVGYRAHLWLRRSASLTV